MQSLSTLIGREAFPRVRVSKMNSARHCRLTVSVVPLLIMGWTWAHFSPRAPHTNTNAGEKQHRSLCEILLFRNRARVNQDWSSRVESRNQERGDCIQRQNKKLKAHVGRRSGTRTDQPALACETGLNVRALHTAAAEACGGFPARYFNEHSKLNLVSAGTACTFPPLVHVSVFHEREPPRFLAPHKFPFPLRAPRLAADRSRPSVDAHRGGEAKYAAYNLKLL
jgi:hypothetical protein